MHALYREGPWVIVAMAIRTQDSQWAAQCWLCRGTTPHFFPRMDDALSYDRPETAIAVAHLSGRQAIAYKRPDVRTDAERLTAYRQEWAAHAVRDADPAQA